MGNRQDVGIDKMNENCQRCGGRNMTWFIDSDIWNRVMKQYLYTIVCPVCFAKLAESNGIQCTGWQLVPENYTSKWRGEKEVVPEPWFGTHIRETLAVIKDWFNL